MSYAAVVTTLTNVREHPNADRLLLASAMGNQVIVGLENKEGDVVLFFESDGQLSEEYAQVNDLVARKDEHGNRAGGFFSDNRRVRAQNLRGAKSEGYVASLESVAYTGFDISKLQIGDQITVLNDHPICNKYYTPATLRAMKNGQGVSLKKKNVMLPKHKDSQQFRYYGDTILPGSICYITEKVHGTSARLVYGKVEKDIPNGFWRRVFKKPVRTEINWEIVVGSRNLILGDEKDKNGGYYGDNTFRYIAANQVDGMLRKGEVIYSELAGWANADKQIMLPHQTSKSNDKAVKKQYGDEITYNYGNPRGEFSQHVYRIALANEDGQIVDLSWPEVKARCAQLGLQPVLDVEGPIVITEGNRESFIARVNEESDAESLYPGQPLREGVVVRVEGADGSLSFLKQKGYLFRLLEGILKEDENYVDTEESA